MRGNGIGTLEVFAGDKTSLPVLTSIWKKKGQQTANIFVWDTATIDIPHYSNLVVTIVGDVGFSSRGDIAIDDILLKSGACNAGK
ncbi:thyroid hormone-induced protein B-like [Mytilus trossulus]|uniref:thyroid hormone-induced protein B-like n=1 Tax=Mytilus trossulus TaxID=6551 RepID=UPI003007488F